MATWTDLTFTAGDVLSATKLSQEDINFDAIAEGSIGSPKFEVDSFADSTFLDIFILGYLIGD